jgi:hypothetical protein
MNKATNGHRPLARPDMIAWGPKLSASYGDPAIGASLASPCVVGNRKRPGISIQVNAGPTVDKSQIMSHGSRVRMQIDQIWTDSLIQDSRAKIFVQITSLGS